jgi:hypothetical protein
LANVGDELHPPQFDQHHYIRNANGHEELYDPSKDPAEQVNLGEEEDLQP